MPVGTSAVVCRAARDSLSKAAVPLGTETIFQREKERF